MEQLFEGIHLLVESLQGNGSLFLGMLAIFFVIGLILATQGYSIFKVVLAFMGFIAGSVGFGVLSSAGGISPQGVALAAFAGGMTGAMFSYISYFVGIFIFGGTMFYLMTTFLAFSAGFTSVESLAFFMAIVGGIVALIFQKIIIVLLTALSGAWLLSAAGLAWLDNSGSMSNPNFEHLFYGSNGMPFFASWGIITLLGIFIQYNGFTKNEVTNIENHQEKATQ